MPLSDEERTQLEALQAKEKEPEPDKSSGPQIRQHVNVTVDLNDETQVRRAIKSGLLPASYLDDDDEEEEEESDDDEGGKKKKAKKDPDDDERDDSPRRRLDRY